MPTYLTALIERSVQASLVNTISRTTELLGDVLGRAADGIDERGLHRPSTSPRSSPPTCYAIPSFARRCARSSAPPLNARSPSWLRTAPRLPPTRRTRKPAVPVRT